MKIGKAPVFPLASKDSQCRSSGSLTPKNGQQTDRSKDKIATKEGLRRDLRSNPRRYERRQWGDNNLWGGSL